MTIRMVSRFLPLLALAAVLPSVAEAQTASGTLRVTAAEWLPTWDPAGGGWAVVRAGTGVSKLSVRSSEPEAALPPGNYDVYWIQDAAHRDLPVLVAEDVTVAAGQSTEVRVETGIIVEVADWVPPLGPNGRISAFARGTSTELNWTLGEPMVLPPGDVEIYWDADVTDDIVPVWLDTFDIEAPFGGIGTEVQMEAEVTVIRVAPDGPADRAGLVAGDEILAAGGTPLAGMPLVEAVEFLRGPSGSSVVVSIRRDGGQPFDVTVVRGVVDSQTVLRVDAGLRVVVGAGLPPLRAGGYWGVAYAGQDPATGLLAYAETADATLLVGHTVYDIYWRETADAELRLVAEAVNVEGGITEVPIAGRRK